MFSDLQNHWAKSCILKLAERNLVHGYPDGSFRPDAPVTRAEFAVLMFNCFSRARIIRNPINFKDVPTSHWAGEAIKKATQRGFLVGYPDQTFKPDQPIPRVQTLIAYASHLKLKTPQPPTIHPNFSLEKLLEGYFEDAADIPNYAKPLTLTAAYHYLVVNYPNVKKLNPNQPATRAEVAALICQALQFWGRVPLEYIADQDLFAIFPQFYRNEYSYLSGDYDFKEGLLNVDLNAENVWIDTTGQVVINSIPYSYLGQDFSEGLLVVSNNGKSGFVDRKGNLVIELQFEQASAFSEGLAGVKVGDFYGYINQTGTVVIQPQFESVGSFENARALVQQNQKYGFINPQGEIVISPAFDYANNFSEGLASVKIDNKYGFINLAGEVVISPQFERVESFSDGLALVKLDQQYSFVNPQGEIVIETPHLTQSFSEGLAAIKVEEKWGFMNKKGEIVIEPQFYGIEYIKFGYPIAGPFSEGLAIARLGDVCGFIDKNGNWIIRPKFSNAGSFFDGVAVVNWGGEWITRPIGFDGSALPIEFETVLEGGQRGYIKNPLTSY